jgi:hypothetical protein
MARQKVLFICGSLNQTTIAHAVARHLQDDYACYFTPYYCDAGLLQLMQQAGLLEFTVMGGNPRMQADAYLEENNLPTDLCGVQHNYDLVVTLQDLVIQKNIRGKKIVLIQEGMTDPENLMYHLVKWLRLPRYLASTATTGLSDAYQLFCVASEGYRDLFIKKGVNPSKIAVTGIPNFDNAVQYLDNDFPHRNYVLVATSDARETLKFENRRRFIRQVLEIAGGRPLIFKLHPNEKVERATREIKGLAPHALVFADGNTNHMIANCDVLITQYSSVVYIGLALEKEVHSYFELEMLRRLTPIQNGGTSGRKIAAVCRGLLEEGRVPLSSSLPYTHRREQELALA